MSAKKIGHNAKIYMNGKELGHFKFIDGPPPSEAQAVVQRRIAAGLCAQLRIFSTPDGFWDFLAFKATPQQVRAALVDETRRQSLGRGT